MSKWIHSVALTALITTSAPVVASTTDTTPLAENQLIAQNLVGECRAVNEATFVYPARTVTEPIRALQFNEKVTLAENQVRNGWIAINSPVLGFVEARFLKPCDENTVGSQERCRALNRNAFVYPRPIASEPIRVLQVNEEVTLAESRDRNGWVAINSPIRGFVESKHLKTCNLNNGGINFLPPDSSPNNSTSTLCRRVIFVGEQGLIIRQRPSLNAPRAGSKLYYNDQVLLSSSPPFDVDASGREWIPISQPQQGWVSNGFPRRGNDNNFAFCR